MPIASPTNPHAPCVLSLRTWSTLLWLGFVTKQLWYLVRLMEKSGWVGWVWAQRKRGYLTNIRDVMINVTQRSTVLGQNLALDQQCWSGWRQTRWRSWTPAKNIAARPLLNYIAGTLKQCASILDAKRSLLHLHLLLRAMEEDHFWTHSARAWGAVFVSLPPFLDILVHFHVNIINRPPSFLDWNFLFKKEVCLIFQSMFCSEELQS